MCVKLYKVNATPSKSWMDSRIKAHHNQAQAGKRRQEHFEREGVIRSLTAATVATNFDWTLNVCCHARPNQFRVGTGLSRTKAEHKPTPIFQAIDDRAVEGKLDISTL